MSCSCNKCNNEHSHNHGHSHSHGHSHEHEKENLKTDLIMKGIGILCFALGFIIKSYSLYLFLFAYTLIGYEVIFSALKNLFSGHFLDENFLMFVASVGAYIIGDYPEAVAVMFFYSIGEFFQDKAVDTSRKRIEELMSLSDGHATLITDEGEKEISPKELSAGDIILVKPGEIIPADGEVISGESSANEASLTGESLPKALSSGSKVLSGSVNGDGVLKIRVTGSYEDSTVAKILKIMEDTPENKTKTENFVTSFSKIYTPFILVAAALIAFIPPVFTGFDTLEAWVYRGLVFLTVSCPCALVLSIPLSFSCAIGACSKKGVLVKGSCHISALASLKRLYCDKTGTLTKGTFTPVKINAFDGFDSNELTKLLCYAEAYSNHPLALAVKKNFAIGIDEKLTREFTEKAGFGTKQLYNGKLLLAGNLKLLSENGISVPDVSESDTVIYVAYDGKPAGYIEFSDELRDDAEKTVKALRKKGIKIHMLTGDNRQSAERIAKKLSIKEFRYGLLPHEKVDAVRNASAKKSVVGFIGDGINDAPALKLSDIGISLGGVSSDAAVEASDAVIMTDSLYPLTDAISISVKTRRIVAENLIFILLVKAGVLIATALGMTFMWMAVVADVGTALIAVANSLRIMRVKNGEKK